MHYSTKNIGNSGEIIAINYLQKKGYKIIATNYFIKGGEIDIVAKKDYKIIFIEVKYRKSLDFGTPEDAMTKVKKQRFLFTIQNYIISKNIEEENIEADFISITEKNGNIEIKHYKNIDLYN
ncbi:YraN family protein [Candidatus Gracilibacteria bacterium]|nr:YraN family protein [Candidatus Gracilibacteria bacterium]